MKIINISTLLLILVSGGALAVPGEGNIRIYNYNSHQTWTRYDTGCAHCVRWDIPINGQNLVNDCGPILGAYGFANNHQVGNASCNGANVTIYQSPVFPYIEPGAWYDKSGVCKIEWVLAISGGGSEVYKESNNIIGMTKSTGSASVRYSKASTSCREDLLTMGVTWGYTGSSVSAYLRLRGDYANTSATMCLYIDGKPLKADCPNVTPPAPEPVPPSLLVCDAEIPQEIDFGSLSLREAAGHSQNDTIGIICNRTGNVTISFSGGSNVENNAMKFSLGSGMNGNICFTTGNDCINNGYMKQVTTNGTIKSSIPFKTTITTNPEVAGDYSAPLIVVVQPN
ncbi:hypothetical protein WOB53_18865 [Providencia rettgeri]|uniref:hypothetical protein n=1 Tax=Providencia rettgeri TaxID=587 RepID=UPI003D2A175C